MVGTQLIAFIKDQTPIIMAAAPKEIPTLFQGLIDKLLAFAVILQNFPQSVCSTSPAVLKIPVCVLQGIALVLQLTKNPDANAASAAFTQIANLINSIIPFSCSVKIENNKSCSILCRAAIAILGSLLQIMSVVLSFFNNMFGSIANPLTTFAMALQAFGNALVVNSCCIPPSVEQALLSLSESLALFSVSPIGMSSSLGGVPALFVVLLLHVLPCIRPAETKFIRLAETKCIRLAEAKHTKLEEAKRIKSEETKEKSSSKTKSSSSFSKASSRGCCILDIAAREFLIASLVFQNSGILTATPASNPPGVFWSH